MADSMPGEALAHATRPCRAAGSLAYLFLYVPTVPGSDDSRSYSDGPYIRLTHLLQRRLFGAVLVG